MYSFILKLVFFTSIYFFSLIGSSSEKVYNLDDYVVTASRLNQDLFDLSPSVSTFNKEDIEDGAYVNLTDVLWQIPGIFLVPTGGIGKATSLFTRGSESNHTTILFNDRRLPTGFSGQYDSGLLGLVNVGSVEFVKGDNSSLYGGAIGGIINLRSFKANKGSIRNFNLETGSNAFRKAAYNTAYGDESLSITYGLETLSSNGFQENSDFERITNNLYLKYQLKNELEFDFQFFSYNAELGVIGDNRYPPPSKERNNTNAWLISPGLTYKLTDRAKFKIMINLNQNKLDTHSVNRYDSSTWTSYTPEDSEYGSLDNVDKIFEENIKGLEAYWEFNVDKFNSKSIIGFMLEDREYERNPFDGVENNSNKVVNLGYKTRSIFYQNLIELNDMTAIKLGARYDNYSELFPTTKTGNFEISHSLSQDDSFKLFLKASNGKVVPDMNALIQFSDFDSLYFDSLNFKLENSKTREIGFKKLLSKQEIGIIYFNNQLRNIADTIDTYDDNYTLIDKEHALVDTNQLGAEAYIKGIIFDQFNYSFSYSYLDADIQSGQYFSGYSGTKGSQLIRRPMHKFSTSIFWQPTSKYSLGLNYLAGWNREDSVGDDFEALESARLFGSIICSENTTLFFRIENAFDQKFLYTKGFPAPPRQMFIGAKFNY
jgi:vitamin B12 transporter